MRLCLVALSFGLKALSKKDVRQYYYWVNEAELAICDSNYAYANECYDKAFSIRFSQWTPSQPNIKPTKMNRQKRDKQE